MIQDPLFRRRTRFWWPAPPKPGPIRVVPRPCQKPETPVPPRLDICATRLPSPCSPTLRACLRTFRPTAKPTWEHREANLGAGWAAATWERPAAAAATWESRGRGRRPRQRLPATWERSAAATWESSAAPGTQPGRAAAASLGSNLGELGGAGTNLGEARLPASAATWEGSAAPETNLGEARLGRGAAARQPGEPRGDVNDSGMPKGSVG